MATENIKSTSITNIDAGLNAKAPPGRSQFIVKGMCETVSVAAAVDAASTYRFCRVRSGWLYLAHSLDYEDVSAATGTLDIGLYLKDGGAAVDVNCIQSGIVGTSVGNTGVISTVALTALDGQLKTFWELAGASADTNTEYDVAVTSVTAGGHATLAGDMTLTLFYSDMGV